MSRVVCAGARAAGYAESRFAVRPLSLRSGYGVDIGEALCLETLQSGGALVSNLALASGPSVKLGLSNPAVKAGGRSGPY